MRNQSNDVILRMENIVKCYGSLIANDNVSLHLNGVKFLPSSEKMARAKPH
jgi:ABC-type sugar transport system ATPase subunit